MGERASQDHLKTLPPGEKASSRGSLFHFLPSLEINDTRLALSASSVKLGAATRTHARFFFMLE
jgi:hypothetical protein